MLKIEANGADAKYQDLVNYAFNKCDAFILIFRSTFPYQYPPNYINESVARELEPYLIHQEIKAKSWPGVRTNSKQYVMNVYRCCKKTKKILLSVDGLFDWGREERPEDLCFVRKNRAWLVSTSHEKLCLIYQENAEDIEFFRRIGLVFHETTVNVEDYHVKY